MLTRGLRVLASNLLIKPSQRLFGSLPDHDTLKMPALSPTMTEGTIVKWNKKEGDKVSPGDVMFEVETDKAVVGFEVQDEVYLAKILASEGTSKIPLGQPVAILVSKADRVSAFKDYSASQPSPQAKPAVSPSSSSTPPPEAKPSNPQVPQHPSVSSDTSRKFISPLAKNLAKEHSIDYNSLNGSGPHGRIIKDDILKALSKKEEKKEVKKEETADRPGYKDVPHSSMRKVTADRLLFSKQTIPHYYLSIDTRVDKLNDLRKQLNDMSEVKISVNDLVIKAAALACLKVPEVNSSWNEGSIRVFDYVDISMAVQTPKGLITPIIKNAHTKRIGEIAKESKDLANTAKEGKLKPEQFIGGTFTISNLGMMGIKEFSAIINPPQACILAVGTSEGKVVAVGGEFKVHNYMTVTLSSDHRVVDGAVGAAWLKSFKGYIEEPFSMLI